jgi:hypothetical protein
MGRSGILAVAVVGVLASVGVGYAAVPSADGVIHGCFNTSGNPSGVLRVIDVEAGAKCGKNEKPLNFNQTGPKGDKGDAGIDGTDGADGADGIDGTDGADGVDGIDGIDGAPGIQGPPGQAGISGARFVAFPPTSLFDENVWKKFGGTTLGAGNYVVIATLNFDAQDIIDSDHNGLIICELRHGDAFIGGATTAIPEAILGSDDGNGSMSFTGGAAIGAGGGEISVYCMANQNDSPGLTYGGIVVLQVGSFF